MKKLLLALTVSLLAACSQIDTGNVGVESSMGQVKSQTLPSGVYFTMFKTVTEVCGKELAVPINDLKPQTSDKITLQDLDVDLYVQVDASKAAQIATKWSGDRTEINNADGSCTALGLNYIARQAREVLYDASSKFGSATIHTERNAIAAMTVKALQANLDAEAGKGLFLVKSANVRTLVTDPALEANIRAAANAEFEKQKEVKQKEIAQVQADRKRIEAQGDADAIRIKAQAVSNQGGAEYVELKRIEKWDGKLPQTTGGAIPFFNVSK